MVFLNWTNDENTDVKIVDEQHANMARLINELHAVLGSDDNEKIKNLMTELLEDVKLHFETEERLMKDSKYLNYISHKMEHDRFLNKIKQLNEKIQRGDESISLELVTSLKKWLFNHLEINDRKLCGYLILKGMDQETTETVKA